MEYENINEDSWEYPKEDYEKFICWRDYRIRESICSGECFVGRYPNVNNPLCWACFYEDCEDEDRDSDMWIDDNSYEVNKIENAFKFL